ncbi:Putative anti-sigma factor antagonist [Pontiella desulfatans]|uniref:Anti-sigma factor antagonist n=1 Tax=Pontiella desulfatans TaxID=2750659 RepID=A0A6C2U9Y8_PONDE|nr:STAS domain-containing protein [Pontiella desulfatans]VGO16537.1 Putative anti-sigma factor antagonist [Pontiella desulfatans]
MVVTCTKQNGIGVVQVDQALTAATVDAFRDQLAGWQEAEGDVKDFVLDLGKVDFMDSAGLGTLIAVLKRVSEKGGDMKIAELQKKPRMVFEITRAYKVFEIYDTVDDALKAFE